MTATKYGMPTVSVRIGMAASLLISLNCALWGERIKERRRVRELKSLWHPRTLNPKAGTQ